MLKRKTIKQLVVEVIGAIWFFLALVSTIVLIVLNCTSIYNYVIHKYNLTFITGLSEDRLMLNYQTIISYLQKTGGGDLELPDFPMSETGIIHFADVKNIFISLYIIVLLFIFVLGIYLVMKHHDKDKCILSIFNKGTPLAVGFRTMPRFWQPRRKFACKFATSALCSHAISRITVFYCDIADKRCLSIGNCEQKVRKSIIG